MRFVSTKHFIHLYKNVTQTYTHVRKRNPFYWISEAISPNSLFYNCKTVLCWCCDGQIAIQFPLRHTHTRASTHMNAVIDSEIHRGARGRPLARLSRRIDRETAAHTHTHTHALHSHVSSLIARLLSLLYFCRCCLYIPLNKKYTSKNKFLYKNGI